MKRNNSLCFLVSIFGLRAAGRNWGLFPADRRENRRLPQTNRERTLLVHAVFGKRIFAIFSTATTRSAFGRALLLFRGREPAGAVNISCASKLFQENPKPNQATPSQTKKNNLDFLG